MRVFSVLCCLVLATSGCAATGARAGGDELQTEIRKSDLIVRPDGTPCWARRTAEARPCPLLGPNPYRIAEALGGRGATTQYDPAAAEDSVRRVHEFLVTHLGN